MTNKIDGKIAPRGNLENLKKQAKQLLMQVKEANPHALSRLSRANISKPEITLADAQTTIARENGYASWPELKAGFERSDNNAKAAPNSIVIKGLDQIWIDCKSVAEATAFYSGILKLEKVAEVPDQMAFFDCSGTLLLLGKRDEIRPNSILYFEIGDSERSIQDAYNNLKDLGVKMGDSPHCIARGWNGYDAWIAFFFDPFGNQLAFKANVPVAKIANS